MLFKCLTSTIYLNNINLMLQVLEEFYLFNFGDHGGVLVAVKYFKSHGETDVLKYSTDEGESWHDHVFTEEDLRIYGLMTEPGENTTVFTMFGSAHSHHQWLIIKVDLRNAFCKFFTCYVFLNYGI